MVCILLILKFLKNYLFNLYSCISDILFNYFSRRNTNQVLPYWKAPETIKLGLESNSSNEIHMFAILEKCDIWSLGITAIEIAEKIPPLFNIHPMRALFMITRLPPPTLANKKHWTFHFQDFVKCCLTSDPIQRLDAKELLKHKFVTSLNERKDNTIFISLITKCKIFMQSQIHNRHKEEDEEITTDEIDNLINSNLNNSINNQNATHASVTSQSHGIPPSSDSILINNNTNNNNIAVNTINTTNNSSSGKFNSGTFVKKEISTNSNNNNSIQIKEQSAPSLQNIPSIQVMQYSKSEETPKTRPRRKSHKEPIVKQQENKQNKAKQSVHSQLLNIYKQDATIKIPMLSIKNVSATSLIETDAIYIDKTVNEIAPADIQISSESFLRNLRYATTLSNLLAINAYHKKRRDLVPMNQFDSQSNQQVIRDIHTTLKTIIKL